MAGKILYKSSVRHDLKNIRQQDVQRLLRKIREELTQNPRKGEPLHGEFEGLYKFRVGDYRVIYTISGKDALILRIRHRAKAYD
ncbi:MAG: type II toxin-antitoxin system mRNA interferase toxin, RelE/StbE family [Conexivisphaerales archaeon]